MANGVSDLCKVYVVMPAAIYVRKIDTDLWLNKDSQRCQYWSIREINPDRRTSEIMRIDVCTCLNRYAWLTTIDWIRINVPATTNFICWNVARACCSQKTNHLSFVLFSVERNSDVLIRSRVLMRFFMEISQITNTFHLSIILLQSNRLFDFFDMLKNGLEEHVQ